MKTDKISAWSLLISVTSQDIKYILALLVILFALQNVWPSNNVSGLVTGKLLAHTSPGGLVSSDIEILMQILLCTVYSPPSGFEQKKNMRKKTPLSEKKKHNFSKKKHFLALYLFLKEYFIYLFYIKYPLSMCLKLLTTYSLIFQKPPILQNSKHL